jgi:hypothetical protein
MRMLEEWKFSDGQIISEYGRYGKRAHRRFCIECGYVRLREPVTPGSKRLQDYPPGFGKGDPFYIRGQKFVLYQKCDELGKVGSQRLTRDGVERDAIVRVDPADHSFERRLMCENCEEGNEPRSRQELPEEVWAFARNSEESAENLRENRTDRNARRAYYRRMALIPQI